MCTGSGVEQKITGAFQVLGVHVQCARVGCVALALGHLALVQGHCKVGD